MAFALLLPGQAGSCDHHDGKTIFDHKRAKWIGNHGNMWHAIVLCGQNIQKSLHQVGNTIAKQVGLLSPGGSSSESRLRTSLKVPAARMGRNSGDGSLTSTSWGCRRTACLPAELARGPSACRLGLPEDGLSSFGKSGRDRAAGPPVPGPPGTCCQPAQPMPPGRPRHAGRGPPGRPASCPCTGSPPHLGQPGRGRIVCLAVGLPGGCQPSGPQKCRAYEAHHACMTIFLTGFVADARV